MNLNTNNNDNSNSRNDFGVSKNSSIIVEPTKT